MADGIEDGGLGKSWLTVFFCYIARITVFSLLFLALCVLASFGHIHRAGFLFHVFMIRLLSLLPTFVHIQGSEYRTFGTGWFMDLISHRNIV